MESSRSQISSVCRSCGDEIDWEGREKRCPKCGAWPTVPFGQQDQLPKLEGPPPGTSMWAFDALLPYRSEDAISLGEGGTPIVNCPKVASSYDVGELWIKDEGQNPTGSIRDRELSLAASDAVTRGTKRASLVAPGAAVQSFGAYAARTDLEGIAGLPARAPFQRKAMANVHGLDLTVVRGRLQETRDTFAERRASEDLGRPFDAFQNPFRHAGARTLAAEISAFFDGSQPEAIVVPTGSGTVLVGLYEGLQKLVEWDVLDQVPRLYAVQPTGCAPIADAARLGAAIDSYTTPDTVCGELEDPNPRGGKWALEVLAESGGGGITVTDDDILDAGIEVARKSGLEIGIAAAAGPAGVKKLRENGVLSSNSRVLVIGTGTGGADLLRSRLDVQ